MFLLLDLPGQVFKGAQTFSRKTISRSQVIWIVRLSKLVVPVNSIQFQKFGCQSLLSESESLDSLCFLVFVVPVDHVYHVESNEFLHVPAHWLFNLLVARLLVTLLSFK